MAHKAAKEKALDDLQAIEKDLEGNMEEEGDDHEGERLWHKKEKKRSQVLQQLKKLCPGKSTGPTAISNAAGEVLADPAEISAAQKVYWSEVFKARAVDKLFRSKWLREEKAKGPPAMHAKILSAEEPKWKIPP